MIAIYRLNIHGCVVVPASSRSQTFGIKGVVVVIIAPATREMSWYIKDCMLQLVL